jgi:hypothetical protein
MARRASFPAFLILTLLLAGCALPPPDQPAHYTRMGRFLGLVADCGCSDIDPDRMIADYPHALGTLYTPDEIKKMKGYVELGATEKWDNQESICADVCSRACMVNAVAGPLGGRMIPGVPACLVSERNLSITEPEESSDPN